MHRKKQIKTRPTTSPMTATQPFPSTRRATQRESALAGDCNLGEAQAGWRVGEGEPSTRIRKKIPKLRKTPQNSLKLQAFLTVGKGYRTPKDANSNQYT
jgi:hypothetical protein